MPHPRNYYQISKVDQQRNQEQMVAEVKGLREAEKLIEKHLQNIKSSEKTKITYRVSKLLGGTAKTAPPSDLTSRL